MVDPGGILLGVGAIITAVSGFWHHGKKLNAIDKAVNSVPNGAPPLWERIDQQTLLIGEVKGLLIAHVENQDLHAR